MTEIWSVLHALEAERRAEPYGELSRCAGLGPPRRLTVDYVTVRPYQTIGSHRHTGAD